MPDSSTSVIVVGAGPAGVSLAYLLASRGVSVTLLERQRDFAREFRGEVLLPSGLEALQQSGLVHSDGRVGGVTVRSQPAFLEAVINTARAFPNFRVELGVTVSGLVPADGRVGGVTVRRDG